MLRKELYLNHVKEEQKHKQEEKDDIIRQITESDRSITEIIQAQQYKKSIIPIYENPVFEDLDEEDPELDFNFDPLDTGYEELIQIEVSDSFNCNWTATLKNDAGARAGGYTPQVTFTRAIKSSFSGLLCGL